MVVLKLDTNGKPITKNVRIIKNHPFYGKPKVMVAMYGDACFIDYSHNLISAASCADGGHMVFTFITNSDLESEILISLKDSVLYRYFKVVFKEKRAPLVKFLSALNDLPLDRKWSDQDLFLHFNLTDEEIIHMNSLKSD